MSKPRIFTGEKGIALLVTLIALSVFSLLGLYMTLEATTGLKISDNHEGRLKATYAALAGLNHARALLRGLDFNDLLKGPDGAPAVSAASWEDARSFASRNPLPVSLALSLDISDPASDLSGLSDDGILNTGFYEGTHGTVLIPLTGISQSETASYGGGTTTTSSYFVKVTDNNREASELALDPDDNPFFDGDGTVIVRSIGVARTISEMTETALRRNSVVVFEARFRRRSTFDLGPALVVEGNSIDAYFEETCEISGGLFPGIGVIDTNQTDWVLPEQFIRDAAGEGKMISGAGLANPSVQDITGGILSGPDRRLLLDPGYLWDFVHNKAPRMADDFYGGDQDWMDGSTPYAGAYDPAKPVQAPGQDPRMIVVNGNLNISGSFSGGGLLVVTGDLSYSGAFSYCGLIMVLGTGRLSAAGTGPGITGAIFLANLPNTGEEISFGVPGLSIGGNARITANRDAVKMAIGLIPASQISFREIAGSDP